MQISNIASFDMFLSAIAILIVVWVFAQIWAHLADELIWWATPTSWKVVIKTIQWKVATFFVQIEVWNYNTANRISRRWTNPATLGLRATAECDMRKAINIAEAHLEELSLLLNGIQE